MIEAHRFNASFALGALVVLLSGAAMGAAKSAKPTKARYLVTTGQLTQDLEIAPSGKRAVTFKLQLSGTCQRTVTGVARLKGGDLESDEDETGTAYFADEYIHRSKDGCELFLRIQEKTGKRAVVMQAESCKTTCNPVEDLMFRTDDAPTAKKQPAK